MKTAFTSFALIGAALISTPAMATELSAAQAEEVRSIVREVLADTSARTALLDAGATASINEAGRVVISSADQSSNVEIGGLVQFRYVYSNQNGSNQGSQDGFYIPRAKLFTEGNFGATAFRLSLAHNTALYTETDDPSIQLEDAYIIHDLGGVAVQVGQFKNTLSYNYNVDTADQLAVERSVVSTVLGGGRAQGINFIVGGADEIYQVQAGVNTGHWSLDDIDGGDEELDNQNIGLTVRGDLQVIGDDWSAVANNRGIDGHALRIGGGVHAEYGDNFNDVNGEGFIFTADATYKVSNFSVTGAVYYVEQPEFFGDIGNGNDGDSILAGEIEVGYLLPDTNWDIFGRLEGADFDGDGDDYQALVFGANYQATQNVRFTVDAILSLNGGAGEFSSDLGDDGAKSLFGWGDDSNGEQDDFAIRGQMQLAF